MCGVTEESPLLGMWFQVGNEAPGPSPQIPNVLRCSRGRLPSHPPTGNGSGATSRPILLYSPHSRRLSDRCLWFSSLVARKENLTKIESFCYEKQKNTSDRRRRGVQTVRRVPMGAGHKSSTILMWSFLDEGERRHWANMRGWG